MYYEDDEINKSLIENRMKAEEERKQIENENLKKAKNKQMTKKVACIAGICALTIGSFGLGGFTVGMYHQGIKQANKEVSSNTVTNNSTAALTTAMSTHKDGSLSVAEVASKAADSVVEITTEVVSTGIRMQQYISEGAGSGVVISKDGYIVTNNHVIDGASKITVRLRNGESYSATLVGTDSKTDIALLKIEGVTLQPAIFGNSDNLQVGEMAVAIGNPLGQLGGTVTDGIISALDREITIDGETMNLLQTNAAINPGNSGGGLFNDQGQLIGLVVAKSAGSDVEGLGFAIPVNEVKAIADELMNNGYVTGRPMLGVSIVSIDSPQLAIQYGVGRMGVYIQDLTDGTNSVKSGLQIGDCIIAIDNQEVATASDISAILRGKKVGDTVNITVSREGKMINVDLKLSENKPASN